MATISPLDGRYAPKLKELQLICGDDRLMLLRIYAELQWFRSLVEAEKVDRLNLTQDKFEDFITKILIPFEELLKNAKANRVKIRRIVAEVTAIEMKTNHDVKAVEMWTSDLIKTTLGVETQVSHVHFAITSEDINSNAYASMHTDIKWYIYGMLNTLNMSLGTCAREWSTASMLSLTHGQAATPTTLGREMAVFFDRLSTHLEKLKAIKLFSKPMSGAVGNYNAHYAAYPDADWEEIGRDTVVMFDNRVSTLSISTQINPHEDVAELLSRFSAIATTLVDFSRDMWGYISRHYVRQKVVQGEVGSSVMPHKVNPIDFENAEGNAGLAIAMCDHMARKLPVSRFQRDLSDSTVMRNVGVAAGYLVLSIQSCIKGLSKCAPNVERMQEELESAPEILAEAVQTVMRSHGIVDAYDQLKKQTRGKNITQKDLHNVVDNAEIPGAEKESLKRLKPTGYTGRAEAQAKRICAST